MYPPQHATSDRTVHLVGTRFAEICLAGYAKNNKTIGLGCQGWTHVRKGKGWSGRVTTNHSLGKDRAAQNTAKDTCTISDVLDSWHALMVARKKAFVCTCMCYDIKSKR